MRHTSHDKSSIAAALVKYANTTEQPYCTMKADTKIYRAIHIAVKRDNLPIQARSFRAVMAIGSPEAVSRLDTKTAAALQALKQRKTALEALAALVDTWNPYHGLQAAYGAPESFSQPCKMTDKPWRTEQPHETDLKIYGTSLEQVAARYPARVCRYVPTAAELDAMQVPGV